MVTKILRTDRQQYWEHAIKFPEKLSQIAHDLAEKAAKDW